MLLVDELRIKGKLEAARFFSFQYDGGSVLSGYP